MFTYLYIYMYFFFLNSVFIWTQKKATVGKMFPLWGRGEGDVHTHKENPSFFNSTIFMPLYIVIVFLKLLNSAYPIDLN